MNKHKKHEGLVSIIVPVYNAERYISRCLESILLQSYKNYELIIVNDGSTDQTSKICNNYALKDNRIRVINQKNSGVSNSRNRALDEAHGEYVMFIDADDWIDYDYLLKMINGIDECDIVISSFRDVYEDGAIDRNYKKTLNIPFSTRNEVLQGFVEDCLEGKIYTYVVWGKLYRKDIIEDVRFVEIAYSEDATFIRTVMTRCNSITFIEEQGYNYYINGNGVTSDENRLVERIYGELYMQANFYREYSLSMEDFQSNKAMKILEGGLERFLKAFIKNGHHITKENLKNIKNVYKLVSSEGLSIDKKVYFFILWILFVIQIIRGREIE